MLHIKYYILFLMGIFISLGIGISIGFSLGGNDLIENQQKSLIEQMQKNYEKVKEKNTSLQAENEKIAKDIKKYKNISAEFVQEKINSLLDGVKVAIIQVGSKKNTDNFIHMINADIASHISFTERDVKPVLSSLQDLYQNTEMETDKGQDISVMSRYIIESLYTGLPSEGFTQLRLHNIISMQTPVQYAADCIILLGDQEFVNENNSDILCSVLQEAKSNGIPIFFVLGGQPISSKLMNYFRSKKIDVYQLDYDIDEQLHFIAVLSQMKANVNKRIMDKKN